jgi:hypothetical protein
MHGAKRHSTCMQASCRSLRLGPIRQPLLTYVRTPSVSFYLSLDSAILHYPATNKKKRREYVTVPIRPPIREVLHAAVPLAI